ncbi:MAG: tetratricopeptide repeat protein, partial [Planctomycetota bacterium]
LELIDVLATRRTPGTPRLIVSLLPSFAESNDRRLLNALLMFGGDGWEVLREKLFGEKDHQPAPDAARQPRVERLYVEFVRQQVLNLLMLRLEHGGFTGYYREMFTPVYRYGALVIDLFGEIARNDKNVLNQFTPEQVGKIREMAPRAIGDSHHPRARAVLTELVAYFETSGNTGDNEPRDSAVFALYVVGDTARAQVIIDQKKNVAEHSRGSTAVRAWYELAHTYLKAQEYTKALSAFQKSTDEASRYGDPNGGTIGNNWYNTACIHSRLALDETDDAARSAHMSEALKALRNAVQNGFADWSWIFRDHDLAGLWQYDGFRKWVQELRADPAQKALMPDFEPGHAPEDDPSHDEHSDLGNGGNGDGDGDGDGGDR